MNKIYVKITFVSILILTCCGAGYKGSLPDIGGQFEYLQVTPKVSQPLFNARDDFDPNFKLKNIPRENKSYIDVILKKDKTSPYINDINDAIVILEKMKKCIRTKDNIQQFNAIASSIIDHADYITSKYGNGPERYYISYVKLQNVAAQAREVATLRCESQVYLKYLTTQGDGKVYSQDSIQHQIDVFGVEVERTLKILKDAT